MTYHYQCAFGSDNLKRNFVNKVSDIKGLREKTDTPIPRERNQ